MRMEGLEPPCLAALDPKSSASTNFATSAFADVGKYWDLKEGLFASDNLKHMPAVRSTNFATSANWSAKVVKILFEEQRVNCAS